KRLLIYDTCQSSILASLNRDAIGQRAWVERLYRNRGTHAIMAVPPGEQAKENEELGHGLLTYVLLAAAGGVDQGPLKGKTLKPNDQVITVRDWFGYAEDHVPELMDQLYGRRLDPYFPRSEGAGFPILQIAN
ncbi:MAG: hypothetical protein KDA37_03355, partial [Planctomycetales bacterium]|nr:hypothetical protein [Planctomycetales bacterium]